MERILCARYTSSQGNYLRSAYGPSNARVVAHVSRTYICEKPRTQTGTGLYAYVMPDESYSAAASVSTSASAAVSSTGASSASAAFLAAASSAAACLAAFLAASRSRAA